MVSSQLELCEYVKIKKYFFLPPSSFIWFFFPFSIKSKKKMYFSSDNLQLIIKPYSNFLLHFLFKFLNWICLYFSQQNLFRLLGENSHWSSRKSPIPNKKILNIPNRNISKSLFFFSFFCLRGACVIFLGFNFIAFPCIHCFGNCFLPFANAWCLEMFLKYF